MTLRRFFGTAITAGILVATAVPADAAAHHRDVARSEARAVSRFVAENYFADMLSTKGRGHRVGSCAKAKTEWRCKTFAWNAETHCSWVTWVRPKRSTDYWAEYHQLECKTVPARHR